MRLMIPDYVYVHALLISACMPNVCEVGTELWTPRSIDISLANNMPTTRRQSYEVKISSVEI